MRGLSLAFYLLCSGLTHAAQNLTVDLPYASYTGVLNSDSGLRVWKGIRYAAAPTGPLRWQAPTSPVPVSGAPSVLADEFGARCPQSSPSFPPSRPQMMPGDEDCLFLNVYSPEGTNDLPVFVSIHGGGYGLGNGNQDMTQFVTTNGNSFVAVTIQYRLGAFGFLSSTEVKEKGVINAGILDQKFALEWVQEHIGKFGGDPDRVTIAGESAGAGSVLLHAIAEDGELGTSLFRNLIAASPWVPTQPYYDDEVCEDRYSAFAEMVGCSDADDIFACLTEKESIELQQASHSVSSTPPTPYGSWGFTPVTDGDYISGPPSIVLQNRKVNGERLLVGNNANEGPILIPFNIRTENDLTTWIRSQWFRLSESNITHLLAAYPSTDGLVDPIASRFETDGLGPATAVNVSAVATGQQQRAFNFGAESAVICQSYWLAEAFTSPGHEAFHYQYSVPFAIHGADLTAYYGPPTPNQGPDLVKAFSKIYGNFITKNNPSIPNDVANGKSAPDPEAANPASQWPIWTDTDPQLINLNQTGGTPYTVAAGGTTVRQFMAPGQVNQITVASAYNWEGGRGKRCEVWREISPFIPQ